MPPQFRRVTQKNGDETAKNVIFGLLSASWNGAAGGSFQKSKVINFRPADWQERINRSGDQFAAGREHGGSGVERGAGDAEEGNVRGREGGLLRNAALHRCGFGLGKVQRRDYG